MVLLAAGMASPDIFVEMLVGGAACQSHLRLQRDLKNGQIGCLCGSAKRSEPWRSCREYRELLYVQRRKSDAQAVRSPGSPISTESRISRRSSCIVLSR